LKWVIPMSEIAKIQKSGNELVISIPPAIYEQLDLKEGDEVEMEPFTCGGETGARIRPKK